MDTGRGTEGLAACLISLKARRTRSPKRNVQKHRLKHPERYPEMRKSISVDAVVSFRSRAFVLLMTQWQHMQQPFYEYFQMMRAFLVGTTRLPFHTGIRERGGYLTLAHASLLLALASTKLG